MSLLAVGVVEEDFSSRRREWSPQGGGNSHLVALHKVLVVHTAPVDYRPVQMLLHQLTQLFLLKLVGESLKDFVGISNLLPIYLNERQHLSLLGPQFSFEIYTLKFDSMELEPGFHLKTGQ